MNRRNKIIFVSILAIVVIAVLWFVYSRNKASNNVASQNGNVSELFPFTGTNATDYQPEPNSNAPQNTNGSGGILIATSTTNNGNTNGSGYGTYTGGGGGGNYNSNSGVIKVLDLSDLSINTNTGNDSSNQNSNFQLGLPPIFEDGRQRGCNTPSCSGLGANPYAGQISLTVNGSNSANLTSDGGIIELVWRVGSGEFSEELNTTCIASSSKGDWVGSKAVHSGHDVLQIGANTSTNVVSGSYSLNCIGIGMATVTINTAGVQEDTTSIIPGSSVSITANGVSSYNLSKNGGSVRLDWRVTLPAGYTGTTPVCTAQSVEDPTNWNGRKTNTGTNTISIPGNIGLDIISNKYTISCTRVGDATATVNVSGPAGEEGGIIAGSSIAISANDRQSLDLDSEGGPVTLKWKVTLPIGYSGPLPICTASSAADINAWTGDKDTVGTEDVTLPGNTDLNIVSTKYTISCTRVGQATANVNVSGPAGSTTGIIDGDISFTVNDSNFLFMDYNGGDVNLKWNVTLPEGRTTTCNASSSANDWTGTKVASSSTEVVTIPSNTSTSTQSRTYTMTCTGIGAEAVSVSTNISSDAFLDRTPAFVFTANGGTNVTIPTGTPIDLSWRVQNIAGDSCFATSDGSYAGWGKTYIKSLEPLTGAQQTQLNTWTNQLATAQAQLDALNAISGTTSVSEQITTLQNQIATNRTLLADLTASSTRVQTQLNTNINTIDIKKAGIQTQTNIINTKNTYLNQLTTHLDTVSAMGGLVIDALTIDQTTAEIDTTRNQLSVANTTKAELQSEVNGLQVENTNLTAVKKQYVDQQATVSKQITAYQNQLQKTQTTSTQTSDTARQQQIKDLQNTIAVLQGQIAQLNNRPYTLKVVSSAKTLKLPHFAVGPTSATFMETVGTDGAQLIGDVPITGKRVYTLQCGTLPAQSVTINVDDSGYRGTDQSLSFLVNGDTSTDVTVGDTVTLSWTVSNMNANSCRATSDGSYNGWGSTMQKVSHVRQPGNYVYYTDELLTDSGGTIKAPTTDVGTNSQTFTETIGKDNSITATRTYTLQCGTLAPQTVTINVDSKPSIVFLANGEAVTSVAGGSPVELSWEVRNIAGGSCRGTSTGGPSISAAGSGATVDLGFPGWGAPDRGVVLGGTRTGGGTGGGGLTVSTVGTIKAPSTNVGAVSKTFTETVGKDGSIGSERTYTLTCNGLDGTSVAQTVIINGPDVANNTNGTNVDSSGSCGDVDIETARIQLTNLLSTYESLTGNVYDPERPIYKNSVTATSSIADLAVGGIQTNPSENNPYHRTGEGYFESCASDTHNGADFMKNPGQPTRVDSHIFNPDIFPQYNIDVGNTGVYNGVVTDGDTYFKRNNTFLPMWDWTDRTTIAGNSIIQGTSFVPNVTDSSGNYASLGGKTACHGIYIGDVVDLISFTPVGAPCAMNDDSAHIGLPSPSLIGNIAGPIPVVQGNGRGSSASYDANSYVQSTDTISGSGNHSEFPDGNGFQVGYNNSNSEAAWWLYDLQGASQSASNVLARYSIFFDQARPNYTLTTTRGTASGTIGLLDAYSCNSGFQGCGANGDSRRVYYSNSWYNFYKFLNLY